ncbi:MAG TPA: cupin domain-containing protein [Burkholderiales bacterium]|nr:cupin domain-containing protein [Burkholderiales bacterium]
MDWETIRWPGETGKMLFHPRKDNPTEPNAGLLRFEPGAHHPLHRHDFAQVWYVLEGRFRMGTRECGPGSMIWHSDPHYEEELSTETGGLMLIVQYPGPTTGGRPIYDERFNMEKRKSIAEERTDL